MDIEELAMMLESIDVAGVSEDQFELARENAKKCKLEDDQKLALYGLFKQATIGNNIDKEPYSIDFVAHAKW